MRVAQAGQIIAVGVNRDAVEVVVEVGDGLVQRVDPPHPVAAYKLGLVVRGEQEAGGWVGLAAGDRGGLDEPGVAAGVIVAVVAV